MSQPSENPLFPASLAANGIQGADAKALGPRGGEHSPQGARARVNALSAINAARGYLACYALATDSPEAGMVDAADLLDAAADCLAPADFSDAIKSAPDGGA